MTRLKLILISLLACLPIYISTLPAAAVSNTNLLGPACLASSENPTCDDSKKENGTGKNTISGPHGVIQEATTVFAIITIIGGVIISVYSGIVFVTAGGARAGDNSSRARNARTTFVSAMTGIVIAALAWTIITYVNTHIVPN
jgi:hypothetical protein